MPGRRSRAADDDDEPEHPRRRVPTHPAHRTSRPAVRAWERDDAPEDDDSDDGAPGREGLFHRRRERVYFRARDSLYFEPLVALAIVVLLFVALYAYTSNLPPVYVVESESMQHGTTDIVGLINTGDLVLAKKVDASTIQTYVDGERSGYSTYGEHGDVLLYQANGRAGTPVIHRAIVFLEANADGSWNAPSLAGLSCGTNATDAYSVSSTPSGCGTTELRGVLTLRDVGWKSVTVTIALDTLGRSSGFVTMGDNNYDPSPPASGVTDQSAGISTLVEPAWVVGVARGSIPWIGSVKLLLQGNAQEVPPQSWEYLGLSVVALVLIAMGLHYLLRAEGVEDPRRKALEEAEGEDDEEEDEAPDAEEPSRRRWLHPLRAWRGSEDEEEDEEPVVRRHRGDRAPRGGRPAPKVGRSSAHGGKRSRHEDDDADEDL